MAWIADTAAKIERLFGFATSSTGDGLNAAPAQGGMSHSGKHVTVDSALQIATVWACVRLLAETIATLPLSLYERDGEGHRHPAREHNLYRLLHDQPNADMTAAEFWEAMVAGMATWGNGYAEKEMSGKRVIALTPLRPELMTVTRDRNGSLAYRYNETGGKVRELPEDRVFHLKNFSLNGLVGLSPVAQARHTLGMAQATEAAASKLYADGLRGSGVMEAPGTLNATQRADADVWLRRFREAQAAGGIPLVEGGFVYKPISLTPEDAQMLQVMGFSVEEICRWYRVPPFMVGHTEKTTSWGTGLEQQMIGFLTFSLRPYLTKIEQTVKKSLLSAEERARYYAEFNLEGLLRADSAGRAALYATYAQNGIKTRNEMRAMENDPPRPGGDVLTVQSNLLPLDKLGTNFAAPAAPKPPEGGE
jgi:HK97 family phage portal protein